MPWRERSHAAPLTGCFFLSALTTLRVSLLILRCLSVPDGVIPRCREVKAW